METVAPLAGTLSNYGLYAIVALLVVAVVYLFKRQSALEKEIRDLLTSTINENSRVIGEATKIIEAQSEVLNRKR